LSERYFAFGANVHPATLERRGVETHSARPARLDGYRLVFDMPGIPLVEPVFASVEPAEDHVWGALYELDTGALSRLRSFEGVAYEQRVVEVECAEGRVAAQIFVNAGRRLRRAPSRRYLSVIIEGARLRALPDEWVARLEVEPAFYLPVVHELWSYGFALVDRVHRRLVAPARRR